LLIDLVSILTPDEVTLDGSLRRPDADIESSLPIDCIIMHHGVGSNFYKPHFHDPMAEKFLARGCAVMRVNNRGHDLAYNHLPQGRLGAAFETIDDCRIDWKCWIDYAESQGFERIGLWGHSLGAVKTIYFMATENDQRIQRVIASSPPRFSHSAYLARNDGVIFGDQLALAQKLKDAGEMDTVFAITVPTGALMTTRTFFDKYGPEERYDIMKHLPGTSAPLLVLFGGLEGNVPENFDRFGFGGLADKVTQFAAGADNATCGVIEGGDHFYNGVTDELWAAVDGWLSES
jgi:pimeloyl-ACP methyl ester carboxylesterase